MSATYTQCIICLLHFPRCRYQENTKRKCHNVKSLVFQIKPSVFSTSLINVLRLSRLHTTDNVEWWAQKHRHNNNNNSIQPVRVWTIASNDQFQFWQATNWNSVRTSRKLQQLFLLFICKLVHNFPKVPGKQHNNHSLTNESWSVRAPCIIWLTCTH